MKIFIKIAIAIVALILLGYLAYGTEGCLWCGNSPEETTETTMIRVATPIPNAVVTSPLVVKGEARGNWYFEASFPVRLYDGNGKEIAVIPAQAQGEWMTTEFVPFEISLPFSNPTTTTGTLVLEKDNASGLPEHDAEIRIPVRFAPAVTETRPVSLYYYNESKDKDASGNILCSAKGLEEVDRQMPVSITPIQDSIKLLLRGELTTTDRARGITTEFPLPGLALQAASVSGSILTLTFTDPQNKTSGGSCRTSILRAQIEATAKQFPNITQVRITPVDLFQP